MPNLSGASSLSHGMRSTYIHGCRCNLCRAANAEYYRAWRSIPRRKTEDRVDAERAREYLTHLSEVGIGRNSVHRVCGVGKRILWEIAAGKKRKILRSTEKRILAVKPQEAMPMGAYVDAKTTRQQIEALVAEGFSRSDIAERLRRFDERLRIGQRSKVRVSNAIKINELYRLMTGKDEHAADSYFDAA